MEVIGYFPGEADLPIHALGMSVEQATDFLNQPVDVDYGVALKHFG